MFRRWFIWCFALVVLGGAVAACADQKLEKTTVKLIAAEYGFTVVEDMPQANCDISGFEMVSFLNDGERYVQKKEMRARAVTLKANLGLVDVNSQVFNAPLC